MPCRESSNSPTYQNDGSITRVFNVWDVYDAEQAAGLVLGAASPIYNGRIRDSGVSLAPKEGPGVWEGTVTYKPIPSGDQPPPPNNDPPEGIVEFDTSGGTQHITTAISQSNSVGAPNVKDAIGVSVDDGSRTVEGVDIVIPKLNLTVTKHLSVAFVTPEYIKNLARLTGKTNSQQYGVFDEGELLFLGANGSARGRQDWEITFAFEASQNYPNLTVAPGIVVDKFGHEYLWVTFKSVKDGNHIVQQPEFAYVAKVYQSENFLQVLGF